MFHVREGITKFGKRISEARLQKHFLVASYGLSNDDSPSSKEQPLITSQSVQYVFETPSLLVAAYSGGKSALQSSWRITPLNFMCRHSYVCKRKIRDQSDDENASGEYFSHRS